MLFARCARNVNIFQLLSLSEQKHRRISPSFSVNRSRLLPDQWKLRRKLECFVIHIRYINFPDDDYFYNSICSWNTYTDNLFNGGFPGDIRYSMGVEFVYSHENFIWMASMETIHICRFTHASPYHRSAIPPTRVPRWNVDAKKNSQVDISVPIPHFKRRNDTVNTMDYARNIYLVVHVYTRSVTF